MNETSVKIAIIGTEGAGKTVFLTCLAKRYEGGGVKGCCLEPLGKETSLYVDRHWRGLNDGIWPPATNAREMFKLHWRMRVLNAVGSEDVYMLRAVDSAGHDLRSFFADEAIAEIASLPDDLRLLAEYCREADVVLILINLKDFMAEDELERATANQWAIKFALDYKFAQRPDSRCALVFTQVDSYQELLQEMGSFQAVAERYLPHVYAGYLRNTQTPLPMLAVSAVNKTRLMIGDDGLTRSVPDDGFGSEGFDELMAWIAGQAEAQACGLQRLAVAEQSASLSSELAGVEDKIGILNRSLSRKASKAAFIIAGFLSVFAFLVLLEAFASSRVVTRDETFSVTEYVDEAVDLKAAVEIDWADDHALWVNNDMYITNNNTFDWTNARIQVNGWAFGVDVGRVLSGQRKKLPDVSKYKKKSNVTFKLRCDQDTRKVPVQVPKTKKVAVTVKEHNWALIAIIGALAFVGFFIVALRILKSSSLFKEGKDLHKMKSERQTLRQRMADLSQGPILPNPPLPTLPPPPSPAPLEQV